MGNTIFCSASSRRNGQCQTIGIFGLYTHKRLRSTCVSTQSDQSSVGSLWVAKCLFFVFLFAKEYLSISHKRIVSMGDEYKNWMDSCDCGNYRIRE